MKKKAISMTIDEDLLEELEKYQNSKRMTRSQVIRIAILNLIEKGSI
jgi:metal-responsive CopG/Arc/MetJ family transcriptional regulator